MILLDTHFWIWLIMGNSCITARQAKFIKDHETLGLGVSAISCWEVALKVSYRKLELSKPIDIWLPEALAFPGIQLIDISPLIALESTRLPGDFHRDPADRFIVASARVLNCPLLTMDERILKYPHVNAIDGNVQLDSVSAQSSQPIVP